MKILFVNDGSITNPILQAQGLPHLSALAQRGHEVFVLSFESDQDLEVRRRTIIDQYTPGLHFLPVRMALSARMRVLLQILIVGHFIILFYAKKYSIEIIHARGYAPTIASLFARTVLNVRLIFDMRGLMIDEIISKGRWKPNSFYVRGMRLFERQCILHADYRIVVSQRFRQHVESLLYVKEHEKALPIGVVQNSVEVQRFVVPEKDRKELRMRLHLEDRFVLLYAGSLDVWQLPGSMAEFFVQFKKHCPNAYFLILTYSDTQPLSQILREENIPVDSYSFMSILAESMPLYLSLGNLGIMFRKDELLNNVSSPLKIGEYLAAGMPVLLNRGIGDTEHLAVIHRVGIFVDQLSRVAFAKASDEITRFFAEDREQIVGRCRQAATENFSFEEAVNRYDAIYRNCGETTQLRKKNDMDSTGH